MWVNESRMSHELTWPTLCEFVTHSYDKSESRSESWSCEFVTHSDIWMTRIWYQTYECIHSYGVRDSFRHMNDSDMIPHIWMYTFIRSSWLIQTYEWLGHMNDSDMIPDIWMYTFIWSSWLIQTFEWLGYDTRHRYGVATISRLLKVIGLFCKRGLANRRYSEKKTYHFRMTMPWLGHVCDATDVYS